MVLFERKMDQTECAEEHHLLEVNYEQSPKMICEFLLTN